MGGLFSAPKAPAPVAPPPPPPKPVVEQAKFEAGVSNTNTSSNAKPLQDRLKIKKAAPVNKLNNNVGLGKIQ